MIDSRFTNRLLGMVPVITKKAVTIGPCRFSLMGSVNHPDDTQRYTRNYTKFLPVCCGTMGRYLIISGDKNFTRKISLIGACRSQNQTVIKDTDDFDLFEGTDKFDPVDFNDGNSKVMIANLSPSGASKEQTPDAYNLAQIDIYNKLLIQSSDISGFLFTGINISNLDQQLDAIACCNAPNIYIDLPQEAVDHPAVRNMIYNEDYEIVRSEGFDWKYYLKILEELAAAEGISFETEELKKDIILTLMSKCRTDMSEETVAVTLNRLCNECGISEKGMISRKKAGKYITIDSEKVEDRLNSMCGLMALKNVINEYIAVMSENQKNPKMCIASRNMLFIGDPGTGKTSGAALLSQIASSHGISNGIFNVVARKDIIGSYVGHTAPKVAECFEKSRNGILFVDEAGFFLEKNSGGFVHEALKEFVRFMELYRDVTVIFALYPGQVEDFLSLDAGLASRISRKVIFDDYSDDELVEITVSMLKERGYTISDKTAEKLRPYFSKVRKNDKDSFGNARESRKIADTIIRAISIRHFNEGSDDTKVQAVDINSAIESMTAESSISCIKETGFGFCC